MFTIAKNICFDLYVKIPPFVIQDKYTLYGKTSLDASFEFDDEFLPDSYDHLDHARPALESPPPPSK